MTGADSEMTMTLRLARGTKGGGFDIPTPGSDARHVEVGTRGMRSLRRRRWLAAEPGVAGACIGPLPLLLSVPDRERSEVEGGWL